MAVYNRVTAEIAGELESILGKPGVVVEQQKMESYGHDEVSEAVWTRNPEVVVKPGIAEEVAAVLRLAGRHRVPVTPRGAGTGLSAGAVPMLGGIVLSLEKMDRILEIDTANMFVVVEPGVTTGQVQKAAREAGFLYAGDPCSADSSFIRGNVAENAAGNKAVKYGTTSRHVYGVEVVLPGGEITTLGGKCVKDVTGYDLVYLMVGSEGTLGVVTKIYLKLMPLPRYVVDLLVPFAAMQTAIDIVLVIMGNGGIVPTCLEFMDSTSIKAAEAYLNQKLPYGDAGAHIIVEVEGSTETQVEEDYLAIGRLCQEHGALEAFVADNVSARDRIWKARKCFAEALRVVSPVYCMEDIVVPVAAIPKALAEIERIARQHGVEIPCAGHAGDGNIHATLLRKDLDEETWHEVKEKVLEEIYTETYAMGGNLSGGHGIGAKRKDYLARFMDPVQLAMIRAVKKASDPGLILNPGKIVDVS